jgi:hypothetical protein
MFPAKTNILIWDKRFTPEWLIEHIQSQPDDKDDEMWRDGGHCYQYIMDEINLLVEHWNYLTYICDSEDIKENTSRGNYSYYSGFVDEEISFLYQYSLDGYIFPTRIIFYDEKYTFIVTNDNIEIEIYETVPKYRNLFFIPNLDDKVCQIKKMLQNTDR